MKRERIDWENLQPLPRKKREGATVDDLANRQFNIRKAKHKGRCHITNQKRRQIALEETRQKRAKAGKKKESFRSYKAKVRAYWLGQSDEHP